MAYQPFVFQERPLSSVKLNSNFAGKADLDSTGKVVASQLPDFTATIHTALDASIAAALAAAATAEAAAQAARTLAAAAIPLAQKAVANGVATLDATSKVPLIEMPYTAGTNVAISPTGVISATGGGGGSSGPTYTPPLVSDFPIWINRGISNATDGVGNLILTPELVGASSGNVLKGIFKPLPTGDFDIVVIVDKGGVDWPFFACGVTTLESSTGRYHSHHMGSVYYADPAYSSLSGDHSGLSEYFWTDANTVSLGIGLPTTSTRLYCRLTRVSGVLTRYFKRSANAPWIGLWGITIPSGYSPDKIGITCLATCYGNLASYPTQTFHVPHFGAVV